MTSTEAKVLYFRTTQDYQEVQSVILENPKLQEVFAKIRLTAEQGRRSCHVTTPKGFSQQRLCYNLSRLGYACKPFLDDIVIVSF